MEIKETNKTEMKTEYNRSWSIVEWCKLIVKREKVLKHKIKVEINREL